MSEGTPSKILPKMVDPRKMAQIGAEFQGYIPGEALVRLADAVEAISQLRADLVFQIDEQGRKVLTGKVEGIVEVECQRCMEPLKISLDAELNLVVVWDEDQAKGLPKDVDPWVVPEQEAELYAILEEEMLLALPVVAYHDYACIDKGLLFAGELEQELPEDSENPFQVLAKLKKNQTSGDDI